MIRRTAQDTIAFDQATLGPFAQLLTVPTAGYGWDANLIPDPTGPNFQARPGPWLVEAAADGEPAYRPYPPLREKALHRRLAGLRPTPSAIQRLANQYGWLGHPQGLYNLPAHLSRRGESLEFWLEEILALSLLVDMWDQVRNRDAGKLGQRIIWSQRPTSVSVVKFRLAHSVGPTASVVWLPANRVGTVGAARMALSTLRDAQATLFAFAPKLAAVEVRSARETEWPLFYASLEPLAGGTVGEWSQVLLERWRFGDAVDPGHYYVHQAVNNRLRGHVTPAVNPFIPGDLYFFPDCFLSAAYTQFALELSGRARPAILCRRIGCGRYFSPANGRQAYCDEACRKLRYYHDTKEGNSSGE